ncbi:NupC/NupG family nucleoside CNT transporter [Priestia endophytica]|uniref:NupC/NupG family nucleoside CNT transporter n=1 Tax=Priestia endophytica TaxID=135735 RepID=UPI000DCA7A05|nr:nucleoside transporter C-terminal domain-containing protein [Priestia endophytica]RAS88348.1 NupC/NupG family nucleoside CNT transporter [Priestia endophytica]
MYVLINIIGILVVLALAYISSLDRKKIKLWPIAVMVVLQFIVTWLMLTTTIGGTIIKGVAAFFVFLIDSALEGVAFIVPDLVPQDGSGTMFFIGVLLPIIFIVAFFDILTYFGIMPLLINVIGWILSKLTGTPRFESFFAAQVMFLGNNEALAVTRDQISKMSDKRLLSMCMMGMSCVSASVLGAYMTLLDPKYVLTAIPLNALGALIMSSLIVPYTVSKEEDVVYKPSKAERKNFFDVISTSMLTGGKMALIIAAMLVGFTALIACINGILGIFNDSLTLEYLFSLIFAPLAFLMGVEWTEALKIARFMGEKLATNEFVAMTNLKDVLGTLKPHSQAVISTFLVSFCNFSTIGIILGSVQALFGSEKSAYVAKYTWRLLLAGILVSCLTAMVVGLFVH